jgi:hypothetical protein
MKFLIALMMTFSLHAATSYRIYQPQIDGPWLPVTYYLNATFDVIQNPYWFSQDNARQKYSELFERIRDPHESIEENGGYGKLIRDEFFSGRVLPNILLHTLGAGYDTLWLNEYFEHYNYPMPKLWTFLLTYAGHLGNEALETSQTQEINAHDHIIDLYFFDVLGFTLGSHLEMMDFLLEDMGMKAWHFQPAWDIKGEDFFNAGLNYVYRPKYFQGKVKPILFTGMQNMGGISVYEQNHVFSLLAGVALTNPLRQKGRLVVGLFHEEGERLTGSLLLNSSEDFRWRVNLYPHFWDDYLPHSYELGFIAGENKDGRLALGLSLNMPFALGVKIN